MNDPVTITIARTGTFTDNRGRQHTFTTDDLDRIALDKEGTPLVFGHPEDNHPAFGWANKVYREGTKLFAQFVHVPGSVREAVRNKHYTRVSMSLYPDGKRLRHVGLLGAVPPAIPGLGTVEMNGGNKTVTLNFSAAELDGEGEDRMSEDAKRLGALEEQVKALTEQNRVLSDERDAAVKRAEQAETKLKEAETGKTEAETKAEAVKAEFSAYRGEQKKAARSIRMDKLVQSGRVMPGERKDLLAQAEVLALIPEPMEFSDGGKLAPEEKYWLGLEARQAGLLTQPLVPPAEFSAAGANPAPADFSKKI